MLGGSWEIVDAIGGAWEEQAVATTDNAANNNLDRFFIMDAPANLLML